MNKGMKKFNPRDLVFILGNYWSDDNYCSDVQECLYDPRLYGDDESDDDDDFDITYLRFNEPCSARGICNHWRKK